MKKTLLIRMIQAFFCFIIAICLLLYIENTNDIVQLALSFVVLILFGFASLIEVLIPEPKKPVKKIKFPTDKNGLL
tara:strand:+ start:65 stop:292 length:228 start_codon:yes stop_codon:yes gene_type:complete